MEINTRFDVAVFIVEHACYNFFYHKNSVWFLVKCFGLTLWLRVLVLIRGC